MASKYASRRVIPADFPEALKGFTREVLRNLPPNVTDPAAVEAWIYKFGAKYFDGRTGPDAPRGAAGGKTQESSRGSFAAGGQLATEELRERILALFLDTDRDGNGYLDRREFKEVVKRFVDELGLDKGAARRIMAEADENADGYIEYHEFVPLAVDVIEMIQAKRQYEEAKLERENAAVERSRAFLLHGLGRDELTQLLRQMFQEADTDKSGYLSRSEFTACLKGSGLGLTRKEINLLLAEVDENEDGRVSYDEFVPLCFNLLVEMMSQEVETSLVSKDEVELKDFFVDLFASADPEGTGRLPISDLQNLMIRADLGLSEVQLAAVLAEAVVDDDGWVSYEPFALEAAAVVAAIVRVQTSAGASDRLQEVRKSEEHNLVLGMDEATFTATLRDAMAGLDVDGSGLVPAASAKAVLTGDLGLTEKQAAGILQLARPDGAYRVNVTAVAHNAFKVLLNIAEVDLMRNNEL